MSRILILWALCYHQPRPKGTSSEKEGPCPFKNPRPRPSSPALSAPESGGKPRGGGPEGGARFVNGAAEGEGWEGEARRGRFCAPAPAHPGPGGGRGSASSLPRHTETHAHTRAPPLPKASGSLTSPTWLAHLFSHPSLLERIRGAGGGPQSLKPKVEISIILVPLFATIPAAQGLPKPDFAAGVPGTPGSWRAGFSPTRLMR